MTEAPKIEKKNFKVVIIGDSAVGKTSLLEQFISEKFSALYKPTIGTDFLNKDIRIDNFLIKLQIWDTAGQENWCNQMGVTFYRGADACIFVYDLLQSITLQNVQKWYDNFTTHINVDDKYPVFLVGNKSDKINNIEVTQTLIQQVAQQLNVKPENSFKCSAKTGENVKQLFQVVAEQCLKLRNEIVVEESENFVIQKIVDIDNNNNGGKKFCC